MGRFSVLFVEKIITSCHMQMKIIRLPAVMEIFNSMTVAMPTAPLQKTMERLSSLFSPSMTNSAAAIFNYRSSSGPHPTSPIFILLPPPTSDNRQPSRLGSTAFFIRFFISAPSFCSCVRYGHGRNNCPADILLLFCFSSRLFDRVIIFPVFFPLPY